MSKEQDITPPPLHPPSLKLRRAIRHSDFVATAGCSLFRLARLNRSRVVWLYLLPAWWGLALASPGMPPLSLLILFTLGAFLMRSAGCVYNDMVDHKIDRQVARTASRPIAAGEVSLTQAGLFLGLLLSGAAGVLFCLPFPAILTGFLALGLTLLYPWMKRITHWPQLFLGFPFNMGLIMGWFSLQPRLSFTPLLFYGGAIFWTLGYDTIYALQDAKDDPKAGVKSTALLVGSRPKLFLSGVYGLTLCSWSLGGIFASLNLMYWVCLAAVVGHFGWQVISLRPQDPQNCSKRFISNDTVGFLVFLGIVFSHLID